MNKLVRLTAMIAVLTLVLAACGGDDGGEETTTTAGGTETTAGGGEGGLSGRIEVSGSSTVEPITALVAEDFSATNPGVAVSVEGPGTGDGFARFCNGETDISDASRPIKEEEAATCADAGIEFVELKVAFDGITVLTSPENDAVSCLAFGDMYALVGPESEGIDTWAGANDLAVEVGGNGGMPDAALVITAPGEESGTYDTFVEFVIDGFAEERGQDGVARADYQASANDNVIIDQIESNPTSFGWVGFAFYAENTDALKAIAVQETPDDDCIEPSAESIADGSYPLSRPLFIYVSLNKLAENPALGPFVDFYIGEGLVDVTEAGYVQLPDDEIEATRAAWDGARG